MQRFHLSPLPIKGDRLILEDKKLIHQLTKVLRAKPRDFFHVFNLEEGEYLCQIESINKKEVVAKKIKTIANHNEPDLRISLYQAIPKKPALFEWIVQKATEIGVHEIFPLITQRTEGRRMPRLDRMESIAKEAAEQCRRLHIPILHHPVDYDEVIGKMTAGYMAYENESVKYLADYRKEMEKSQSIQLIIGPEGGFNQQELTMAKKAGIQSFSLGKRILRMETAAMGALALLLLDR